MVTSVRRSALAALAVAALVAVSSCGGSDDTSSDDSDAAPTTDAATQEPPADDAATAESTTDDTAAPGDESGDFEPGDVSYRVINVLDEPVDVYVRTSGLVEAFTIELGVEPGAVTDLVAPPDGGVFLVTEAGGGDPTCVTGCDHFIAELSAFEEAGPIHTVVLHPDSFDASAKAFDLWEQPQVGAAGNANAMPAADPAAAVAVVTAIAVTDADFGLRLSYEGTPGCVEPFNLENVLIGGNQTPGFLFEGGSADFLLHDNQDRECADVPVGGPFTVDGDAGSRSHVILTGSPGDLDALVVPMADSATAGGGADDAGGDTGGEASGDRDLAIELMTAEVIDNLPLEGDQAVCLAELLVDAIGPDQLLVDGELIDLDSVGTRFDEVAARAFADSITVCEIDPEQIS